MKNRKVNYNGQVIYVGIDVHKKNWTVSTMYQGMVLNTHSMNGNAKELAEHLRRNYPGANFKSVYEAGFCGFWVSRELRKNNIENIIVNPADIPSSNKEKRRKTNKVDSRKLVRELSVGNLEAIYEPTEEQEALRGLCRLRKQLSRDQARTKNRILSMLNFTGIHIEEDKEKKHWSARFMKQLSEIEFKHKEKKLTLQYLLENLKSEREMLLKVTRSIRSLVQESVEVKKVMRCLQSVPGVGLITATTLYTEIMDIKRFEKFDKLCAYVGFVPDTDSTGEKETITGITVRQQKYMRSLLIEAAWTAIRQDAALTYAYGELKKRMIGQRAIVRIAKKLLSRIMYVWKNETNYVKAIAA